MCWKGGIQGCQVPEAESFPWGVHDLSGLLVLGPGEPWGGSGGRGERLLLPALPTPQCLDVAGGGVVWGAVSFLTTSPMGPLALTLSGVTQQGAQTSGDPREQGLSGKKQEIIQLLEKHSKETFVSLKLFPLLFSGLSWPHFFLCSQKEVQVSHLHFSNN